MCDAKQNEYSDIITCLHHSEHQNKNFEPSTSQAEGYSAT